MPSLNFEFEVLCDRIMSADTLSHDTFTLKFTLATSLIDNLERKCRWTWHKIQHTRAIVSVIEGCHEPSGSSQLTVISVLFLTEEEGKRKEGRKKEDSKSPQYFHQNSVNDYKYTDGVQTSFFFANTWTHELVSLNDYKLSYTYTFTKFCKLWWWQLKVARSLGFYSCCQLFFF